jgi:hypothetical protein
MRIQHFRAKAFFLMLVFVATAMGCQATPTVVPTATPTATEVPTEITSPLIAVPPAALPLSGEWSFAVDPDNAGEKAGWAEPTFDDSAWTTVSVPHTWSVMPDYSDYNGIAWYRRTFTAPAESSNTHLRLRFEAVFYSARVWLNGQYLGLHEGGYTPFEFDVSGIVKSVGGNVIAVEVDNQRAFDRIPANVSATWSFDWWNHGGITRDVSLEINSRAYIVRQRVVSIPHITGMDEADSAAISATVTVQNTSGQTLNGVIQADLLDDAQGRTVLEAPVSTSVSIPAGGTADVPLTATLPSPKLWHFDHPNLYRWSTCLLDAEARLLDTSEVTIGIRSVELKDRRFYLNGEPVRLVGVARHADYPGQGSAETVTAMVADYKDLKTLNEVFTRPVHYPQAKCILDFADRYGILLIPEVPAWQLAAWQLADPKMRELEKQQLREMIAEDFNHPSVWAWSIGNEFASNTPEGQIFVKDMIAYVKSLDPTRPVGFPSDKLGSRPQDDATAFSDFVMMNQYFGSFHGTRQELSPALDRVHATWPDKTVIISEFGFAPRWNGPWGPPTSTLDPAKYFFIPDDVSPVSEEADAMRSQVIKEQIPIFRSKPFIAGAIFWSYRNYRTPSPWKTGLIDSDEDKNGSWAVLRDEYAPALIDSVALSPVKGGQRTVTVTLHTRGPVDVDMPAYTLRGYTLHWVITSPAGDTTFSEGDVSLPVLAPGTHWSGGVALTLPDRDYVLKVRIVRPTGFSVTERTYDAQGKLVP